MSSPGAGGGGGGINLPPLVQQIQIRTGINGQATAQINSVAQAATSAAGAAGAMGSSWSGMYGAVNRTIPTWRATGDALRMTGSLLTYQVAMPLIAVGRAAIKASMEFETSMKHIQGLVGVTAKDVAYMSEKVLDMAGSVGKAPEELADALYYITSAGITDTTSALDTLNVSARAASAGLGTTKDVADLSTSVMNAYAPGMYNAKVATDALVAAVREGKADAEDFAPAMGKVIPVAASFGLKFQDVAASIAALTRQGAPAGTAAIQLRQVLSSLLDPTQKATDELAKYGMSASKLKETITTKGLLAGLQELKGTFGENSESLSRVFGNIRPLQAVMALIGPSFSRNAEIFDALTNSAGDADVAYKTVTDTLGYKLNQASAEGKVALIQIGDALSPVIKLFAEFARYAASALGAFASIPGVVKTIATIGSMAIAMTALTKTFASFIRMRAYTTVALQGIANGMRDQTTGMVTNITTGTSYATTMGIATTATGAAGTTAGASAGPFGVLAVTIDALTAHIVELMAVMTENTLITAENTMMTQQLAVSTGGASAAVTTETQSVLAGNTALSQWAASNMNATGATAGMTAATTGATAATTASTAATTAATGANIGMFQSVMQNIRATLTATATNAGLTASTSTLGLVAQGVQVTFMRLGATIKGYAVTAKATMGSMMQTMLPMMAIMAAAWAAFKIFKWATKEKEINGANEAINKLTDTMSEFRVAPLVVGVDVQYTYNGMPTGSKNDSAISKFRDFIYPKDEEGNLLEDGKKIKDEIDGFSADVESGAIKAADAVTLAAGYVQKFGADVKTRSAAVDFFANQFQLDPDKIEAKLKEAEKDAGLVIKNNFVRFTKTIAKAREEAAGGDMFFIPLNSSNMDSYFKEISTFGIGAIKQLTDDLASAPGLVEPLSNALSMAGGSSAQFISGLDEVYKSAFKASGSTEFAEAAVTKYAQAAFKAQNIDVKGKTVTEMLISSKKDLNSQMTDFTRVLENESKASGASKFTNEQMIATFNKLDVAALDVTRNIQGVSDVVQSLQDAFNGGLNPFVNDAAAIFDAYTEALKNAKKGQDALFGSQLSLIDSQANYSTAISTALTDISSAGGDISGFSADSMKAQQALGGVFKSVMEVANATYANTTGTADERQAAATQAAQDYIDAANKAIMAKGGISKEALDNFWNVRLGKKLTVDGEVIKSNSEFLGMTFGQGDVRLPTDVTTSATDAGKDTNTGVASGIDATVADVEAASVASAKAAVAAYKKQLGIKSPSTVMRDEVGLQVGKGLIEGLTKGQLELNTAAGKSGKSFVGAFKSSIITAFGNFNPARVVTEGEGSGTGTNTADEAKALADAAMAAQQKEKARKAELAKRVKLQGSTTAKTLYDTVATDLSGRSASAIYKKGGKNALENFAEGVLTAQGKVKTNITKLVKAIVSEISDKLSTFSAVINAQLNLASAQNDLKKFMVNNTPEMLAASVAAATRAVAQSQMKYGAGQGTEVTQYERSRISTAKAASEQAQRDYRLGKISYADMIDAQTEYANVQAAASEASKENASATTDLYDAQFQSTNSTTLLAQEQMKVVEAQNNLTTAYINAKTAGSDLKDTLAGVAAQAGLASTNLFSVFNTLAGKSATDMGLSGNMGTLITGASGEADAASITNSPMTAGSQYPNNIPLVKPKNPKKGAMYRNSLGVAFRWNGKKWVKVPGYAKGGNIIPGQLSMVGENGPELIRPKSAMNVTPFSVLEQYARTIAHGGGSGSYDSDSSNINIVVNNPVPERASDSIARRMQNLSALGLFS